MRLFYLSFIIVSFLSCSDKSSTEVEAYKNVELIPAPQQVNYKEGYFTLNENSKLLFDQDLEQEADYFSEIINQNSEFELMSTIYGKNSVKTSDNSIVMSIDKNLTKTEQYTLKINAKQIELKGGSADGVMRGIQTLRQLLGQSFYTDKKQSQWLLPQLEINDFAKFKHRGLLLDVCRHFYDVKVVKKYIDALAFYKMNVLHLHLTEDQGWRIESEKYPLLNEIGSWRKDSLGQKYGGFYTKSELKELVAYANERHVTIIPEIELPGHSQAALAAYPQFSCVQNTEKIKVVNDWGVFKEIYCAGNDSTFMFLEDILTEVMEIFPSEYIHIGGDEAPKFRWEHCTKCQKRIKDENLKDEHELQSYFIGRIEQFLNQNNRKLIGWDEILEGGLSANATVQSWRGMQGGIEAANSGHNAIMSPTSHCYFDYDLDKIDLKKVYAFDPIPEDLDKENHEFIIGGECNMWTEHVPNETVLDAKVFPRLLAMAEVLWTYPHERNFDVFYHNVQTHYPVLKYMEINYGAEGIPAQILTAFANQQVEISILKQFDDIEMEALWNDKKIKIDEPFVIKESGILNVSATKNGLPYGQSTTSQFAFHKGLAKLVKYRSEYNDWYTAGGDSALVDSQLGSINFRDGNWQGFYGEDVEVVLDLGHVQPITSVSSNFYHYNNAWIFSPKSYQVEVSSDGQNWEIYGEAQSKIQPEERGQKIEKIAIENQAEARYIKVNVKSIGVVPDWHEAAGSKVWIFMDEIIVE